MSEEDIVNFKLDPQNPAEGKTDWKRLYAMTDEEIMANALSDPDCPPLTKEELSKRQRVVRSKRKKAA